MNAPVANVRLITRGEVQRWLPQLDAWLLDGAFYSVQHTWPQLYRNDGDGLFFVVTDGDRLLSHCAGRVVTLHDERGAHDVGLIGSVATDPAMRGRGLASEVLAAAIAEMAPRTDRLLLWAERPELYERAGFAPSAPETCLALARRPRRPTDDVVRALTIDDHRAVHALHEQKPWRVARSLTTMSTLLSTPGMTTVVLERAGEVRAYACTGKGADLQGHWHEFGGTDRDVAALLPAAMHVVEQIEAVLLLPPYRDELRELLGEQVVGEAQVPGPMVRSTDGAAVASWIDGLDSV